MVMVCGAVQLLAALHRHPWSRSTCPFLLQGQRWYRGEKPVFRGGNGPRKENQWGGWSGCEKAASDFKAWEARPPLHTHTLQTGGKRGTLGLRASPPLVRPRGAEQVNTGLSRVGAGWGQGHFPGVRAWSTEPSRWRPWHGPCGRQVSGWPVSFPREPPGGSRYWPLLRLKGVQLTGSKSSSLQRPRRTLKLLTTQG